MSAASLTEYPNGSPSRSPSTTVSRADRSSRPQTSGGLDQGGPLRRSMLAKWS